MDTPNLSISREPSLSLVYNPIYHEVGAPPPREILDPPLVNPLTLVEAADPLQGPVEAGTGLVTMFDTVLLSFFEDFF